MKIHGIDVPLKIQVWINNALADIFYNAENDEYSYTYHLSSKNSEIFGKYLSVLISKIKEKYGIINIVS